MRKIDQQYIVNLVRQVLAKYTVNQAIAADSLVRKTIPGIDRNLPLMKPSDVQKVVFGELERKNLNSENVNRFFKTVLEEMVSEMRPETLGKICSFGLRLGDGDESTFRKTRCTQYFSPLIQDDGRTLLEKLAASVIAAAIWDYLEVLQIARHDNLRWEEAGNQYYSSFLTESRTLDNSFVCAVVGTGP